jgi:hypothetical protein
MDSNERLNYTTFAICPFDASVLSLKSVYRILGRWLTW